MKGENNILHVGCKFYILRVSWLMSEEKNNFLYKIGSQMQNKNKLNVVNDQIGSPISTSLVAEICKKLILKTKPSFNKIFHLSTKGKISWYDIALHLQKTILQSSTCILLPVSSKDYKSRVHRPKNSLFFHYDIENYLNIQIPNWKEDINPILNNLSFKLNSKNKNF